MDCVSQIDIFQGKRERVLSQIQTFFYFFVILFNCTLCSCRFLSLEESKMHYDQNHSDWEKMDTTFSSEATNITNTFSQSISDELPDGSSTLSSDDTNLTEIPEEQPAEKETETNNTVASVYCQLCKKYFAQSNNLRRHVLNVHQNPLKRNHDQETPLTNTPPTKAAKYSCGLCDIVFRDNWNVKRHKNRMH